MKLIHLLLCVLFGMTVCITTMCSDEADDDYQDEVQDTDDESPDNDVDEGAEPIPVAPVIATNIPVQTAPTVEPTPQASTAQNTPTVSSEVATAPMASDADKTDMQQNQVSPSASATDITNGENVETAALAQSSTETGTAQNQPSASNTAVTSTSSNATSLGQSQQTQTAGLLATKNNQDELDESLPETTETENEPDEPDEIETAVPAANQDKTNPSTPLPATTTGVSTSATIDRSTSAITDRSTSATTGVSTSATTDMPPPLETKSSDSPAQPSPAQPSTDALSLNQTAPNTPTSIQELPPQTVGTPSLDTMPTPAPAKTGLEGTGQASPASSQESTFTPATQKPFSNTIDIKNTDAETILSSIGTLPQPRKLSDLNTQPTTVDDSLDVTLSGPLTKKSVGQAITQLAPLIMSRSVEKAVEQFTNLPAEKALAILEQLIKTSKTDFTKKNKGRPFEVKRNDFLQIIFGVASQYRDATVYNQFFDLIDRYAGLAYGIRPVLFVLSISSYPVLIPDLIAWLEAKGVQNSVRDTGIYALDRTSARAIKALSKYARSALEPVLGSLLLYAISNKKSLKMIRVLVDAGADVNYADASGYTPLIKAVEMGNLRATKLLVENGADIDLMVKDDIGSAWQKSSELSKGTIMEYLQKHAPTKHKPAKDLAF